jgi:hypothetical protein
MARELSGFSMPCQSQSRHIPGRIGELIGHSTPSGPGSQPKYN